MTATLPGLGPPACLRLDHPVWGVDTSTVRMSIGALLPEADGPRLEWSTKSLPVEKHLALRQSLAVRELIPWLHDLKARWGTPAVLGHEQPLAGGKTPLPSFYAVGALLVAVGTVFGVEVELMPWSPSEWKLAATGHGYRPGLPKAASKTEKRKAEKARLMEWARGVGYTGDLEDEADGVGVVVATGIRCEQKWRGLAA